MALYAVMVTAHKDPQNFVIRVSTGNALNAQHWQGNWSHLIAAFDQDAAGEAFAHKVRQEAPMAVHRLNPLQGRKDCEAWANPVDGILQACTTTGFVVQGPHYPQWFAYRDLARDQVQITGECCAAVAQALQERATIITTGFARRARLRTDTF